jgi:hypothetical protein
VARLHTGDRRSDLFLDAGVLVTYTAEPGSPTQDALTLLASWAASTTHHNNASEHENT